MMAYAYLHGFASGPRSKKGIALRDALAAHGVSLALPDLNAPSFAALTITDALAAIDALADSAPGLRWRFIGSSMGGYLATLWAERHPTRVDRLLLLCPAYDMAARWRRLIGDDGIDGWRRTGVRLFPDGAGTPTEVGWRLYEDAARHPAFPIPPCPTRIIHGTADDVVPIDLSRRLAAAHPHITLREVDDRHELVHSLPLIESEAVTFLL
jgi:pimeloyl-ACP methyl ester carboxylesterase